MTNLYQVYKAITAPEHVWRFEKSEEYIKRASLILTGVKLTDNQAHQMISILNDHQAKSSDLRKKGADTDMLLATNLLHLKAPLTEIAV